MLTHHHIKRTAALALALTAIAPAAAAAKPIGTTPFGETAPHATTPIVYITTPAGGFDWADAGIGAAGGLALSLLGVGAAVAVSGHRHGTARIR
jgi:hypothetical protein